MDGNLRNHIALRFFISGWSSNTKTQETNVARTKRISDTILLEAKNVKQLMADQQTRNDEALFGKVLR